MKIAILSFEKKGNNMKLPSCKRIKIIIDTIKNHRPNLLVTSGYSLDKTEDLDVLKKENLNTWILVEVKKDKYIEENGHPINKMLLGKKFKTENHSLYVISQENKIINLGPQFFSKREDVTEKKDEFIIKEFEKVLEQRQFIMNNKKVFVLCCGEINVIKGRDNISYISDETEKYISYSDIILNPTHDCMANYGTLKAKRRFLSDKRIYINSSNWNTEKETKSGKILKQKQSNSFLQNLYVNGEKIEMKRDSSLDYLLHSVEL